MQSIRPNSDVAHLFYGAEWQPDDNTIISVDENGTTLSRLSDFRWDLSPFFERGVSINFGDGSGKGYKLDSTNAHILRHAMSWWLIGPYKHSGSGALYRFEILKRLLAVCSAHGVCADKLSQYNRLLTEIAAAFQGNISGLSTVSFDLLRHADSLGFTLLDASQIEKLRSLDVVRTTHQTPYIPERIWTYQYNRVLECITDFLSVKRGIETTFQIALDAYLTNIKADSRCKETSNKTTLRPFGPKESPRTLADGRVFLGPFSDLCSQQGIQDVISKWICGPQPPNIQSFTTYLTLITRVGLAFILNVSLMRCNEATMLRSSCLRELELPSGERTFILTGRTNKTSSADGSSWVVPEVTKLAVKAMSLVSQLRHKAALLNPLMDIKDIDKKDPLLYCRALEPWAAASVKATSSRTFLFARPYDETIAAFPRLLESEALRIRKSDLEIASRITPGIDPSIYSVGKTWTFAWHQLRRTGAVNMLSSGLVSETTLQAQLKHTSRETTLYYGSNFSRVNQNFDHPSRRLYEDESYAATARSFLELQEDRYVSPHGEKRKKQILSCISEADHESLVSLARDGSISYRETLIGGCVKTGKTCPYGGVTDISRCMGFKTLSPCPDSILDRSRLGTLKRLAVSLEKQLNEVAKESPLFDSLCAQRKSLNRAIQVLEDTAAHENN